MATVHLKIVGGRMSAVWVQCPAQTAALNITNVPDEVGIATVIRHANETVINLPASSKRRTLPARDLSYDQLGRGMFVNLA